MNRLLLFVFLLGCVAGLCVGVAIHDWSMAAHAAERFICLDKPDTTAWMARLPGESHSIETCIQVMKFGNPNWIPEFSHPLKKGEW
jgi:hypothetical protein